MKLALYFTALSLFLNIATAEDTEHRHLDSFVSGLYRTSVKLAESSKVSSPIGLALSLEALRSILAADETKLDQAIKNITGNEAKMTDLKIILDEIRQSATLGLYAYIPEDQSYNPDGIKALESSGHLVSSIDVNNPTEACSIINQQVSDDTNGKITEIINPGEINLETVLIFLNTLYLKHKWYEGFSSTTNNFKIGWNSYPARFLQSKQRRLRSATINGFTITTIGFTLWSGYRMIKIPSEHERYSLYIKLPTGWSQPEPITEDDMRKFEQTSQDSPTDFRMPHVSLNGILDFEKILGLLGKKNAQTILTNKPWITEGIRQRVIVEWDHRGIEAAAATCSRKKAGGGGGMKELLVYFHVDGPFSYMYAMTSPDTSLPIPLFTGIVDSPNNLKLISN